MPLTCTRSHASVDRVLREHDHYFKERLSKANVKIKEELERIVADKQQKKIEMARKRIEGEELSNLLATMTLEDLSAYMSKQRTELASAQAGLEEKRTQGFHKVTAKTQKFMLEFDRFLDAYSGVVNIVMFVDAQYGGVACATLALLFSVRSSRNSHVLLTNRVQDCEDEGERRRSNYGCDAADV